MSLSQCSASHTSSSLNVTVPLTIPSTHLVGRSLFAMRQSKSTCLIQSSGIITEKLFHKMLLSSEKTSTIECPIILRTSVKAYSRQVNSHRTRLSKSYKMSRQKAEWKTQLHQRLVNLLVSKGSTRRSPASVNNLINSRKNLTKNRDVNKNFALKSMKWRVTCLSTPQVWQLKVINEGKRQR